MRCGRGRAVVVPVTDLVRTSGGKVSPTRYWIGVAILAVILTWGFGSFHCVTGARPDGCNFLTPKDGWGFSDQFVDIDDIAGHSAMEIVGNGQVKVARALLKAGCVRFPNER